MDVKQAVAFAKQHILDLFADESLSNMGLEEVEFDNQAGEWRVTVGFSRPWDEAPRNALSTLAGTSPMRRTYKVVRIADGSSHVLSVKEREAAH
jgi:inactivated superfamily I helicase